jgi:tellurite resistance protein
VNIDSTAIRRLRDNLLSQAQHDQQRAEGDDGTELELAVLRRVEPFAETMFLVMMADGDPASIEREALVAALQVLTDARLRRTEIDAMLDLFQSNVARSGAEARLAQIGAVVCADKDDRETAFTLGAVIALADDRVDVRENRILEWVQEYFGVSDRRVASLIDAID